MALDLARWTAWPASRRAPRSIRRVRRCTRRRTAATCCSTRPTGGRSISPCLWWTARGRTGRRYGNPLTDDVPTGWSNLAAVTRCTSIICDTIARAAVAGPARRLRDVEDAAAGSPIRRRRGLDERVVDPATMLDTRLGPVEFWANGSARLCGSGTATCTSRSGTRAARRKPPLWQLHPPKVRVEGGAYWVDDVRVAVPGTIIHLRGMLPYWNRPRPGCDHRARRRARRRRRWCGQYTAGVFQSGVPAGYLKSTQPSMTQDQATQLKTAWLAQHGGAKRSIAVLNATTEFHPIRSVPVDAQLAGAREWSLRDIALAFGVPGLHARRARRLLHLRQRRVPHDRAARSSPCMPWMRRIESTLDSAVPVAARASRSIWTGDDAGRHENRVTRRTSWASTPAG